MVGTKLVHAVIALMIALVLLSVTGANVVGIASHADLSWNLYLMVVSSTRHIRLVPGTPA